MITDLPEEQSPETGTYSECLSHDINYLIMDSLLSTLISKFSKEFLVGLIVVIIVLFIGLLCFSYWAHVEIELFGKRLGSGLLLRNHG